MLNLNFIWHSVRITKQVQTDKRMYGVCMHMMLNSVLKREGEGRIIMNRLHKNQTGTERRMVSAVVMRDVTAVKWRTAMHSSELWSALCIRCEWQAMRRRNGRYTDAYAVMSLYDEAWSGSSEHITPAQCTSTLWNSFRYYIYIKFILALLL